VGTHNSTQLQRQPDSGKAQVKPINLWEAMTATETNHRREPDTARGPVITGSDLAELGAAARWGGQELSVEATEHGWTLRVFSCYDGPFDGIEILIPKDGRTPVKIVKDEWGKIAHIHD
jgi:hypothetical protein